MDDHSWTIEEAYEHGQMDAASVQRNISPERPPELIWLSPEEALADMEKATEQGDEMMQSYYKGYLSRWD